MINLPTVPSPVYEDVIPSTNESFYYRPFILREYKALLQCIDTNDSDEFINTIVAIIGACTYNKIDIDKLTVFDVDYMFIKIRSKSVSDIVPIFYQCNNKVPHETTGDLVSCGQQFSYSLDLNKTYIKNLETYKKSQTLELSPNLFIKMKSPTFAKYRKSAYGDSNTSNQLLEYAFACVDSIIHNDNIILPDVDFTHEQFIDFIDNLPAGSVTSIIEFIQNLPTIAADIHLKCPKCQKVHDTALEGLNGFFK